MENIKEIYKKASTYIIVIFITVYIHDLIIKTSNDTTFVNNFNFAATITSIILSVVAIFYTLIEGSQGKAIQANIANAADEIKKSVDELKEVSKNMKDMKKHIDKLEENIKQSNSELAYSIVEETKEKIKIDDSKPMADELNNIIGNFSLENLRNCLLFYRSFKEKKDIKILTYNRFFNNILRNSDLPQQNIVGSILSTLDFISSLGYVEYTLNSNVITITKFSIELESALLKHVPKEGEYADMPDGIYFGSVYEFFRKMY